MKTISDLVCTGSIQKIFHQVNLLLWSILWKKKYHNELFMTFWNVTKGVWVVFTDLVLEELQKYSYVKKIGHFKKDFDRKNRMSQRQAAIKYKCSQSMINYVLKKAEISCQKRKLFHKEMKSNKFQQKTNCGRLYRKFQKEFGFLVMNQILLFLIPQ